MDACVRCLRDGRLDDLAVVALIVDDASTVGGHAMFERVLQDTFSAVNGERAQAQRVHAVAIDVARSELQAAGVHSVTDCYSDPCGWLSTSVQAGQQVQWSDLKALQQLAQADAAGWSAAAEVSSPGSCCVVIAGLSTLLMRHPTIHVIQALLALRANPVVSSMLLAVHQDLHPPQVMSALQSLTSTVLQLHPVQGLQLQLIQQATGKPCHGRLTASSKRSKVGRLKVEQQLYRLLPDGGVEVFAMPENIGLDARALVETSLANSKLAEMMDAVAVAAGQPGSVGGSQLQTGQQQAEGTGAVAAAAEAGAGAGGDLAKKLGSSMRLEMSEQERAAKAAVQLPYVHQGAGRSYEIADFRQYLPPAAGGYGPGVEDAAGSSKLGHILYVRDSEEEHDSDEDPDNDLDI
eukprot:GHUV01016668.1.p1 GENE.GHUV01016668.1~~GHUV01016668.1.p1  ORF type:complete len:406 (+),score=104.06 GHUV01016668.1:266-1483(+)